MKKIFKILVYLTGIFNVSLFIVPQSQNVYAENITASSESAIYFDEDGNFVFSTYDKIAAGNILYRTVGWIIKKYDEPISAAKQISVVIPTPNYSYEIIDKDNIGYKYSYFVMDGKQVLDFIYSVSASWGAYLGKYGGIVYLDSVMTVSEAGVLKGGIDSSGNSFGEVYIDFNGISTARGWADPACLSDYFDIPVAFPAAVEKPDIQIQKNNVETDDIYIGNSAMAGIALGSHEQGKEEYDIALGIPSGEDIYAYGMADSYYKEGKLIKNTGVVNIPVKVTTDYILKWTDISGINRSEKQQVNRYYYVQKSYEYYTVEKLKVYKLTDVSIDGECIEKTDYALEIPELNVNIENYGDVEKHIKVTCGSVYAGEKVIYSTDNRRPDIPDENQEGLAKESEAAVKVRNDSLSVGENIILSGDWTDKGIYKNDFLDQKELICRTGIIIHENAQNGQYNDTTAMFKYVCGDEIKYIFANAGAIMVHTPIVCNVGVSAPKKYNMAAEPKANQLVAGTDFSIICRNTGTHRNIMGYGKRDYSMYMEKGYVRFPFEVIKNNKKYNANTWIEVKGTGSVFSIPESVPLGGYRIEYVSIAKNSIIGDISAAMDEGIIGETANISINQYGAMNTIDVQVIGTISGFSVEGNEKTAYVGNSIGFNGKTPDNAEAMPLVSEEILLSCRLRITSCGIGAADEDNIIGSISYYYIKEGERCEADVYVCGNHDILGGMSYEKLADSVEFNGDDKILVSEGVYQWEKTIELGENLLVMPKGIKPDSEEIVNQYALREGNILINFNINGYSGKNREYSYINVENYPKGYCNMWKTEGFLYNFVDKTGAEYDLIDGDSIIIGIEGGIFEDYEVVGTH